MATGSDVCASCSAKFDDIKCAIKCTLCEKFFHGPCEGIKNLQGFHMKRAVWRCSNCPPLDPPEGPARRRLRSQNGDIVEIDRAELMGILETVKKLSETVDEMKGKLSEVYDQNANLTKLLSAFIDKPPPAVSYASVVNKQLRRQSNKTTERNTGRPPVSQNTSENSSTNDSELMVTEEPNPNGDTGDTGDAFSSVKRRNRRFTKPLIIGLGDSNSAHASDTSAAPGFTGIERRQWVYVGRVQAGTSVDAISNYVKATWNNPDVQCVQLSNNEDQSSFKIGVRESQVKSLLDPSKWPKLVAVREFVQFSTRKNRPTANFQSVIPNANPT